MPAALLQILRSRWFALCVHAGLWLLLYLTLSNLGGTAPSYRTNDASSPPPGKPVPVDKLEALFAPSQWPNPRGLTNAANPFLTRFFVPPPTPAPPPPPTTRKIKVTYQGFYQSLDRPKQTIVKVGDAFVVAPVGAAIATNLYVAEATMQSLTLTNLTAQTNLLSLNVQKEVEVPIK